MALPSDETVTVPPDSPAPSEAPWKSKKEFARVSLALGLTLIFALAILIPVLRACFLCTTPEQLQAVLKGVLVDLGTFSASTFGPLLAFVLGYYFSGN